ncbi:hypothetical protein GCM10028796_17440 [Ramlibacter monticola]|uniref:Uncharacterized protein n=1 Tax=Ramlibacter monticola TaxID=1926872 RepID=A0A937CQW7_9BURK|nr:hypothetical protein [Ramlibacter monticola]MBL0390570.1 hypothetical protein [Ramlibacter monticola]
MAREATVHAHALYLRACADALRNGDAEARTQAAKLLLQARKIDRQTAHREEVAA